ncbi:hypothetical protein Q3G72_001543 [Acer saccharum]|nr:hypothetical protein Q3G72_001543 [Acer saccharum]
MVQNCSNIKIKPIASVFVDGEFVASGSSDQKFLMIWMGISRLKEQNRSYTRSVAKRSGQNQLTSNDFYLFLNRLCYSFVLLFSCVFFEISFFNPYKLASC